MKRWIHSSSLYNENTDLLDIEVSILYDLVPVDGATILDLASEEFFDFEQSLLMVLDMHDFELEDSYQSDRTGSVSRYYILTKTNEEGTKLRVFVKLRVSDHAVGARRKNGKYTTHNQRDMEHIKKEAKKLAYEKYGQTRGYAPRRLDIIFDDQHYQSYERALRAIEQSLDEFDPGDE